MKPEETLVLDEEFDLRCLCGSREIVTVPHFTQLYAVMNRKGWGLIPTQHGRIVQAVCPDCRPRAELIAARESNTEEAK